MSTLRSTSTLTTELLEKIKNVLKSLKSSLTIQLALASKAIPIQLIIEVKNTDNKYKTARPNKNLRDKTINLRVHNIKNLMKRRLHDKIFFDKRSGR